jgi:hypothetical protein
MLRTTGNTSAALLLAASAAGLGAGLLTLSILDQRPARAAAPGNTRQEAQPQPPPAKDDDEKRVLEAIKTAESRYKEAAARLEEARKRLREVRARQDRLWAARNAAAIQQKLQSQAWAFLRTGTEGTPSGMAVTTIRVRSAIINGAGSQGIFLSLELPLAKDVRVEIDGRERKVTDLRLGMRLSLRLAKEGLAVVKIDATSRRPGAVPVLKAVDTRTKTITVALGEKVTLEGLSVDEDGTDLDIEGRTARLTDLKPGMRVSLILRARNGLIVVQKIHAIK